jgi:hypothetical protein
MGRFICQLGSVIYQKEQKNCEEDWSKQQTAELHRRYRVILMEVFKLYKSL